MGKEKADKKVDNLVLFEREFLKCRKFNLLHTD